MKRGHNRCQRGLALRLSASYCRPKRQPKSWKTKNTPAPPSCSTGVWTRYIAELGHHNVFLASDYRASFDRIFDDYTLPDEPSFYVHAPARTDPAAAPHGQDTLMVLLPVGHLDARAAQDWEAFRNAHAVPYCIVWPNMGMTDLEEHIKFEVSYTPRDWQADVQPRQGIRLWPESQLHAGRILAAAESAQ